MSELLDTKEIILTELLIDEMRLTCKTYGVENEELPILIRLGYI